MVVPARQAYSHWASVGNTYAQPSGIFRLAVLFKRVRNTWISSQDTLFHGRSVVRPVAGVALQAIRIPRHHRLVLGLGHLVFTQGKILGQSDFVFGLIRCLPASVLGLPMVKVPGSTQIISRVHGGVELDGVILAGWFVHIQQGHRKVALGGGV